MKMEQIVFESVSQFFIPLHFWFPRCHRLSLCLPAASSLSGSRSYRWNSYLDGWVWHKSPVPATGHSLSGSLWLRPPLRCHKQMRLGSVAPGSGLACFHGTHWPTLRFRVCTYVGIYICMHGYDIYVYFCECAYLHGSI